MRKPAGGVRLSFIAPLMPALVEKPPEGERPAKTRAGGPRAPRPVPLSVNPSFLVLLHQC